MWKIHADLKASGVWGENMKYVETLRSQWDAIWWFESPTSNIEMALSFQLLSVKVVDLYGYEADGMLAEEGWDRNPS